MYLIGWRWISTTSFNNSQLSLIQTKGILVLQPFRARAFVISALLKLPVYVCKSQYSDAPPNLSMARPSRNFILIPPFAAAGYEELLNFGDSLQYCDILSRNQLPLPPIPPPLPQMAPDVGPRDDDVLTLETVLDWENDPANQDIA